MDLAADAVALSTLFGRADSALVPFIEEPQPDQPLEAELGSPLLAEQLGEVLQGIAWPAAHVFAPQVGETAYPNFAGGAQGMVLDDLKFDELLELFDADVAMDDVLGGPLVAPEEWNGADLSGAGPQPQVVLQQQGLLQRQSQPHLGHARYQQEEEERIQLQMLGSLNSELPLMGLPVFTSPMPAVALWQPQYPETAPAGRGPTPSSSSQQTGTAHIQPSQLAEREASSKVMEQSGNARPPPQPAPSPPPPRALEPEGRAETFLKQISEAFSSRQEQKKMDNLIDQELESKLGIKMPKGNVISEFCDKHGRKALEETIKRIEEEGTGQDNIPDGKGIIISKKSFFSKAANFLGIGRLSKNGLKAPKGGRIRPKNQLEALEQQLVELQKDQMELVQDVSTKQKIVAKLDALFSMKTEVMEDIKSHNVQLDSELQERVQQQLATSLGNLALEERGRATSIPAIMMGRNPKDSPIVDAMVQNWKYSVEQLSLLLNQCTAGGSIVSKEDAGKIELQIANILRFTINNMSPTGGTSFMAFLIRCLDEAQALDVNFVMDKYKRINKSLKMSPSQLKKLVALNSIFTSKIKELIAERAKVTESMSRGVEFADLGFHERLREIQESEKKIIQLRLNYLSLMEIRLLFNYTVLKRVLTPWQTGMCMILCYPMLPDPNFLSCAILGVSDVSEIPWSQFRDLVLAE